MFGKMPRGPANREEFAIALPPARPTIDWWPIIDVWPSAIAPIMTLPARVRGKVLLLGDQAAARCDAD